MNILKHFFFFSLAVTSAQNIAAQLNHDVLTFDHDSFTVSVLSEAQQQGKTDILIGASAEMTAKYAPNGTYPSAVNAFLVETGGKTILVDTGFGRNLFAHLQTCGKKPEDVDAVLLTHMHGDHIGGLASEGKKRFPNATLYISKPEHDYWTSDREMNRLPENRRNSFAAAREIIALYSDRLKIFVPGGAVNSGKEILPGIRAVAAYGHTPGHTAFLLSHGDDRLLVWGDLAHAMAIQMPYPQVAVTYDVDPAKAIESRQQILKYVAENKIRIAGMHIEYPGMGSIRKNASGGYDFLLLCTCEGRSR